MFIYIMHVSYIAFLKNRNITNYIKYYQMCMLYTKCEHLQAYKVDLWRKMTHIQKYEDGATVPVLMKLWYVLCVTRMMFKMLLRYAPHDTHIRLKYIIALHVAYYAYIKNVVVPCATHIIFNNLYWFSIFNFDFRFFIFDFWFWDLRSHIYFPILWFP